MIWRIFKKDWKLLWPLVAVAAGTHVINSILWLRLGYFLEPRTLVQTANLFGAAVLLGTGVLIVNAVHRDVLPGDRQDWLVRPIRRRDLIAAKLLFVLAAVQGPMLLVDIVHCTVMGFAFPAALSAALARNIYMLQFFSLPVLGLATITSTFVEAVGGFLAICLIVTLFRAGVIITLGSATTPSIATMSGGWTLFELWSLVATVAAVIVVPLQYFRRTTGRARALAMGAVLILPAFAFIPWSTAFGFQQWLSADPAAAKTVAIAFDSSLGKLALKPGMANLSDSLWLPLQVSGLAPGSIVLNDRAEVRIFGHDGILLYRGLTTGDPQARNQNGTPAQPVDDFPMPASSGDRQQTHQLITLPHKIYELVRSQTVRLELDYSLGLLQAGASDTIAALNGHKNVANLGPCRTQIDDDGDEILLGCLTQENVTCGTFTLENNLSGQHNPPTRFCAKYYPPIAAHFLPDALLNTGGEFHFRDPQGLAKYPVDESQLANARISIKTYKAVAHFTRHLTIPEIRLSDWEAKTGDAGPAITLQ